MSPTVKLFFPAVFVAVLAGCQMSAPQANTAPANQGDTRAVITCQLPEQAKWNGELVSSADQLKPPYTDDDRSLVERALQGDAAAIEWVTGCLGAKLP